MMGANKQGRTAQFFGKAALIAIAAGISATPAFAQEEAAAADTGAADDIVVTAQRRSESIQNVPISITAVTADTLKKQNVQSVEDYFALTPNVSFQSNGSRDRKDLAIRGISNQLNPYADVRQATSALYIDDFNVSAATSNPQIVDLERIEILRGPQGTYFGRNSVGGAINVSTKKPVNEFEGEIELDYSSFDTKRIQGTVNVPVIDGILALRASGQYEKSDGNIENINPIGGGNDSKFYTGRIQARFTPTDAITWDFLYNYSKETLGMRAGVPTGFVTRTWAGAYYGQPAGYVGDPDGVGFFPENDDQVNFNRPQSVGTKYDYLTSRLQWDFDIATLTAVVGHLESDVFNYGDVDGGSRDFFYEDLKLTRKSTSGEVRLQSNGKNFLDWSIGTAYGKDSGVTNQSTFNGTEITFACPGGVSCNGLEVTGLDSKSSTRYFALFGQGTLNFTDQLSFTAGVRYSWEKTSNLAETRSSEVVTGVNDRSAAFEDVSPKFTLSYKADTNWLLFATASRGFKSGGTQTSTSAFLQNEFDPETLWNYELGTKFDLFDRRVRIDITGFYMDWKDVQQTINFQFNDNGQFRSVSGIANAAAAESYGIEGSFDAKITPEWTLSGQAGYNKSKFKDYPNALINGTVLDISGRPLVNAPKWTLGAQTQYTQPIMDNLEGFGRLEWNYRSRTLSHPFGYLYADSPFWAPSYNNVNVRLGVETEKYNVTFYVENLFKEKYYANAYEKAFYSGVQVEPSYRRIGVNAGYKF
ncbi:TonB-dependent receptor [Sphingomonas sp. DBB INV C78]|uniref:TonB-dependent receptor n=1 Tax=Sphingomonas sp. DBB INV C78 TaxID=3349434 RepID=UPI0036D3E741